MANSFTREEIDRVFDNFFKAHAALLEAMSFLKNINLQDHPETWVTTRQAADRSGEPLRNIQNWAADEKIRSRRNGYHYEVVLEDVIKKHSSRVAV